MIPLMSRVNVYIYTRIDRMFLILDPKPALTIDEEKFAFFFKRLWLGGDYLPLFQSVFPVHMGPS